MPLIGSIVTWPPPSAIPTSKLSVILQPTTTKQKDFYTSLLKNTNDKSILVHFISQSNTP